MRLLNPLSLAVGKGIHGGCAARVGHRADSWYPWSRATFVGTLFATQAEAESALKRMKDIHGYIAPELNGGLFKRLALAQVVPSVGVVGIEFEIP